MDESFWARYDGAAQIMTPENHIDHEKKIIQNDRELAVWESVFLCALQAYLEHGEWRGIEQSEASDRGWKALFAWRRARATMEAKNELQP